jgi:class 3 adenylate cyclase/tetratricopeptide (TPR) repeat protein
MGHQRAEHPREERRVITVFFSDLVGFTERSEELDPEDVRALLSTYYENVRETLEAHGGVVDKFIGDAVLAVFGAPVAHEDDPERAVRAALAIREWARAAPDIDVRMGINTGTALVALEQTTSGMGMVAGDTVNTAARIQSAAPTNGVLVGEPTHRATNHVFEYEERPPVDAKGKSDPVRVWEPLRPRVSIGARALGDAPLVGRAEELALLREALEDACAGHEPRLVTLVGVPGIGKTRLVRELERHARDGEAQVTWLEGRSLPYGEGASFRSLAELVAAHAGIQESDTAAAAEAKLRSAIVALTADERDARWLEGHVRPLLGLGGEGAPRTEGQAEALVAWRRFFELVAARGPLVLVLDDLHWADDTVLTFVDELVTHAGSLPLLVLATARPELLDRAPGRTDERPRTATVFLAPLSDDETLGLVRSLAGDVVLGDERQETLLRRAAGNPLYAEELVRMGADRDPGATLPESVQGLIAARLDGLALEEKELLQDAAVLGQVFWAGALAHVSGVEHERVVEMLHTLDRREFTHSSPAPASARDVEHAFRHPLIREVAYEQIPRVRRAERHRLAAEWVESLPADRSEGRADLLAHHYVQALEYTRATGGEAGELPARAARALREAGDRARAVHAVQAAAEHYRRALELTGDERERGELGLALAEMQLRAGDVAEARAGLTGAISIARTGGDAALLARAALARGGVGVTVFDPDEEVVALLEEALGALGNTEPVLRARLLARLAIEVYYVPPPAYREELSEEAVRLAREADAPEALLDALNARRVTLWSPDRLDEKLAVSRELVELAEAADDRERSLLARTWLVLDLVESGDLEAARAEIDAYSRLAAALGIPAYSWWVPAWRAMLASLEGRFEDARELVDEVLEIGSRAGDANASIYAVMAGWVADLEQGRNPDRSLSAFEEGIERGVSAFRCGLAAQLALAGRLDEAREALAGLGPEGFGEIPRDMNFYAAASEYAIAVGILGDPEAAARAYDVLLPYAGRWTVIARAAVCWGPVDSYLGRLAATAALWDRAESHFEDAVAACERVGARAMAARTRWWHAEMLRARSRPADAERARELEAAARAEADAMGLALSPPSA